MVFLLRSATATALPSFHSRADCLGFPISDTLALFLDSIAVVAVALLVLYLFVFVFFPFSSLRVGGLCFRETIVGTMGSVKRRGGNTRPAGVETRRGELEVVGFRCRFFDDDAMADFVNSGHGLQSWNGDENNLMVDRFDVRHLLSDASVLRRRRSRAPSPDVSDQELDFERYRDLEEAAADGVLDNSLFDEGMIPFLHFVCCLWIFSTLYRILFWYCKPW